MDKQTSIVTTKSLGEVHDMIGYGTHLQPLPCKYNESGITFVKKDTRQMYMGKTTPYNDNQNIQLNRTFAGFFQSMGTKFKSNRNKCLTINLQILL